MINTYATFFSTATVQQAKPFVAEFCALLEGAYEANELGRNAWHSELEALAARLPADPVIVLALAERLDLVVLRLLERLLVLRRLLELGALALHRRERALAID